MESVNVVIDDDERIETLREEDETVITPTTTVAPDVPTDVLDNNTHNKDFVSGSTNMMVLLLFLSRNLQSD